MPLAFTQEDFLVLIYECVILPNLSNLIKMF